MAYDGSSFYGDMIVDEYDEQNNLMNPPSSVGFLFYILLGVGFDVMSDMCTQFMNDLSILTADTRGLDNFWGVSYNMPRPKLPSSQRLLTDEEYKIYLYLRNCRLMTKEDIEINLNKCFGLDDYQVYFSEENFGFSVVDHNNYESDVTDSSNIHINDSDDSSNYVTDFGNDEDTMTILSGLSANEEKASVVNVPNQGWDSEFLEFLEDYISIKGNLLIKEYSI